MRYFVSDKQDIRWNLAAEEYLLNKKDITEPLILLYRQKPCVIIGRNQNVYEEVDLDCLRANDITLTRRISGGGAVYEDLGNFCFSFVTDKQQTVFGDYEGVTEPMLAALHKMGAKAATIGGRNDLYIEGKKFSGNAMYTKQGRTYSHGTLMVDVDLSVLEKVLTVPQEKIESKASKSVRKSVTNLKPYLDKKYQEMTMEALMEATLCQLYEAKNRAEIAHLEVILSPSDEAAIQKIYDSRYANDDWIYKETPNFEWKKRRRIPGVGLLSFDFSIDEGKISAIKITGDFFGMKEIQEFEHFLVGLPFIEDALAEQIENFPIEDYCLNLSHADFLSVFFH